MKKEGYLIVLISISALLLLIYITYSEPIKGANEWAGGDALLVNQIGEITGGQYKPWFNPIFQPASGEIETFLFSLQAAIGALIVGYYIGYWKGQAQVSKK